MKHLKAADGVFISGGRQPVLADSYLYTRTHQELENLLARGGVIAGSSAGATILGSFLVRSQGAPSYDNTIMIGDHTEGFGFIKNIAIDQHITMAGRESHLGQVLTIHPELLGVGIDENTAILVQRDEITVIGPNSVFIHDGSKPYFTLSRGDKDDMRTRQTL